ncbi:unnamed protein product [Arctogadus glacialis]
MSGFYCGLVRFLPFLLYTPTFRFAWNVDGEKGAVACPCAVHASPAPGLLCGAASGTGSSVATRCRVPSSAGCSRDPWRRSARGGSVNTVCCMASNSAGTANHSAELLVFDACDLTLDPNTAHRRLSLSEDNRKVTLVEEDQSVGVYLDRPAGSLSFYSVSPGGGGSSDTLTHIHTFWSSFTQEDLLLGVGAEGRPEPGPSGPAEERTPIGAPPDEGPSETTAPRGGGAPPAETEAGEGHIGQTHSHIVEICTRWRK